MTRRGDAPPSPRPARLIESVAELRRRLGTRHEIHRTLTAQDLVLSTAAVPDGSEVRFDGELESISDGVVVTGTVQAPWVGDCRRCLQPTRGVLEADLREIYETHPTEGETWPLEGDRVDLGPLVHETVLLALPLAPLCSDGCAGPAPDAFPAQRAEDQVDGPDEDRPKDPRWAALDQLNPDQ